ncbi:ROK family transcriptional regulator [Serinibacter arcticus]|uniref:ROK family transcriptional regulator n=1 Tax=Serinibacter arcticus TaxID=1655435 RepID=UPI001304FEF8|nr:ROK family transcriptional regulator [Serinibacter arcticus]
MFSDLVHATTPSRTDEAETSANDHIRRTNLQRVLTLLHYRGPRRRPEIALATGLTRSTVGLLVAELAQRGLVTEVVAPERGRGRPSPMIVANGDGVCAIAVNTESSVLTVALVGLGGVVHQVLVEAVDGAEDPALTCDRITRLVAELVTCAGPERRILGIGVAVPGQVQVGDGVVRHAPHLDWREVPLAAMLTAATGLTTTVGNDAAVILGATSAFGDGLANDLVYLVGRPSGVGGAIISRGRLVHGASGYAGEWGHVPVAQPGRPCVCGGVGCLETEVALDRLLAVAELDGDDPEQLAAALIRRDQPELETEARRQLGHLEVALRTVVNALNPGTILLGGFLAALLDSRTEHERSALVARAVGAAAETVTIRGTYGDAEQVLLGAAELAFVTLLRAPDLVGPA